MERPKIERWFDCISPARGSEAIEVFKRSEGLSEPLWAVFMLVFVQAEPERGGEVIGLFYALGHYADLVRFDLWDAKSLMELFLDVWKSGLASEGDFNFDPVDHQLGLEVGGIDYGIHS